MPKFEPGQKVKIVGKGCGIAALGATRIAFVSCRDCGDYCKIPRFHGIITHNRHMSVLNIATYSVYVGDDYRFAVREDYLEPMNNRINKMVDAYDAQI